jgi:hypothetical protein
MRDPIVGPFEISYMPLKPSKSAQVREVLEPHIGFLEKVENTSEPSIMRFTGATLEDATFSPIFKKSDLRTSDVDLLPHLRYFALFRLLIVVDVAGVKGIGVVEFPRPASVLMIT